MSSARTAAPRSSRRSQDQGAGAESPNSQVRFSDTPRAGAARGKYFLGIAATALPKLPMSPASQPLRILARNCLLKTPRRVNWKREKLIFETVYYFNTL
jgi:hypothetical protein